jgi:phosphopentomutase
LEKLRISLPDRASIAVHTQSNWTGCSRQKHVWRKFENGLIFVNLVDFDMKYGHGEIQQPMQRID